jgi:hypothetical protein
LIVLQSNQLCSFGQQGGVEAEVLSLCWSFEKAKRKGLSAFGWVVAEAEALVGWAQV